MARATAGSRIYKWATYTTCLGLCMGGAYYVATGPVLGFSITAVDPSLASKMRGTGYNTSGLKRTIVKHTKDGQILFETLKNDKNGLYRYVALLESHGPRMTPHLFDSGAKRLAYYMNAYNAFSIFGVLENWEDNFATACLDEMCGWIKINPMFGFFVGQNFHLDGEWVSLWELETRLMEYNDPRIFLAASDALRNSPPLNVVFEADKLDQQLEDASTNLVGDDRFLYVDEGKRVVFLPHHFQRHASSLARYAYERKFPPIINSQDDYDVTCLEFAYHYLTPFPEKRKKFRTAIEDTYQIIFEPANIRLKSADPETTKHWSDES